MSIELSAEDREKVKAMVSSGRFSSESEALHAGLKALEEEENWKSYAKAKIAKGLEDFEAGRVVSREEFLAEVGERRLQRA